jgi:ADP-heptose:LPS heptosyltransferase
MKSVLFLASDDLGETVLATGALAHALEEGDFVTLSAPAEAAALFRAAPATRIWLPPRAAWSFALFARVRGTLFDLVIDGRRSVSGRLAPARRRALLRHGATVRHRSEEWAEALGAERALAPKLWLDGEANRAAAAIAPDATPLLVLAPGGAEENKRWPLQRFAAVARRLLSDPLKGARVAIMGAAARDASITAAIVANLDADGIVAHDFGLAPDLLAAGALMERATLVIGNDNALSHIGAAAGAPTLALFGPTDERVRAPLGPRVRIARGAALQHTRAIEALSIDAVERAALDILRAGGLR